MIHMLIVEDNNKFRTTLRTLLRSTHYDIVDVETGEEGLDKAKKINFDLILVDLVLPGINGLEMINQINSFGHSCKVILMSAYVTEGIKEKAQSFGVDDFLEKPFEILELKDKVNRLLKK